MTQIKSCYRCRFYHSYKETEGAEMPHIFWLVYHCDKKPNVAHLKQFPFKQTTCEFFEEYRRSKNVEML